MPGGTLTVSWPDDEAPVLLSGPCCSVFEGTLHPDFFRAAEAMNP
jgi:diaminopimelate epimerase